MYSQTPSAMNGRIDACITHAWLKVMGEDLHRVAALLDMDVEGLRLLRYRWLAGISRPGPNTVVRMCRLLMWNAATWPDGVAIDWDGMTFKPDDFWNPFRLSKYTYFSYGTERDRGALVHDVLDYCSIDHKKRLGRLLGVPEKCVFQYIYRWLGGDAKPRSRYLNRMLALILWQQVGYRVNFIWEADWANLVAHWMGNGNTWCKYSLPGDPFEWLVKYGAYRRPRRAIRKPMPRPVRAPGYEPPVFARAVQQLDIRRGCGHGGVGRRCQSCT